MILLVFVLWYEFSPSSWMTVVGNDKGGDGDVTGNDGVFTALSPEEFNVRRRSLLRWRVVVHYNATQTSLPPPGDVPNWALFYYPGHITYTSSINRNVSMSARNATLLLANHTIDFQKSEVMPSVHVIAVDSVNHNNCYQKKKTKTTM